LILSRQQILEKWKNGDIKFEPNIRETQISICSINLRVGTKFNKIKRKPGIIIDPSVADSEGLFEPVSVSQGRVILQRHEFLLATTYEYMTIPNDLAALVEGRSTFARYGLSAHVTAPLINPGFVGNLTLEMFNHGENDIYLECGKTQVCQLIFFKVTESIEPKIVESLSKYLGQKSTTPKPD
jgi:dCTP deaminase